MNDKVQPLFVLLFFGVLCCNTGATNREAAPRILHPNSTSVVPQCFQPKALGDKTQNFGRAEGSKTDDRLNRWIIASSQAFPAVDLLKFRTFVEALNPSYNLCSRNTLKSRILADYDNLKPPLSKF